MKNVIYALLAGVAIGMLIAPDKGSETRKRLFGKIGDLSDDLADGASDLSDGASNLYERGKTTVRQGANKAKGMVNDL